MFCFSGFPGWLKTVKCLLEVNWDLSPVLLSLVIVFSSTNGFGIRHWFRQSLYIGFGVSPPCLFVCFLVFSVCQGPSLPWTLSSFWLARLQFSFGILATLCGNCLSLCLDQMLLRKKMKLRLTQCHASVFVSLQNWLFCLLLQCLRFVCLYVLFSDLVVRAPV